MSAERELTYLHLEQLRERFGDVVFISLSAAASYLRKDEYTLMGDKTFPIKVIGRSGKHTTRHVPILNLARWLATTS